MVGVEGFEPSLYHYDVSRFKRDVFQPISPHSLIRLVVLYGRHSQVNFSLPYVYQI
jgi:hypothetical protein